VEKRRAFHRFVLRRPVLHDHTVECASLFHPTPERLAVTEYYVVIAN
jgi:hypothetical protein